MSKNNEKNKQIILEQLRRSPIIEVACQKTGIARSTFYRWKTSNKAFAKKVDEALEEGTNLINEVAESMLISAIQDKNMSGIMFWLRNRHPEFKTRVEVTTKQEDKNLTKEQKELIKQAILLAQVERKEQNE